ncbi:UNVERIFIED_CONTAM: hypothetical protein B566_EDAN019322 [Ephemera danica]|nr:hypothetical protein B566_EDAN019322 [Ephemera danica]
MATSQVSSNLKIVYWNARGLGNKQLELEDFLFSNSIDICGDVNAHHTAWGSLTSSPKGQNIVQFIEKNDLACLNSATSAIPTSKPITNSKPQHPYSRWWTEECDRAKAKRNEAAKNFSNLITRQSIEYYDIAYNEARTTFRSAKKLGWDKACNGLNRLTPITEVWNMVNGFQHSMSRSQAQNPAVIEPQQFNNYICPDYAPTQEESSPILLDSLDMPSHSLFTVEELSAALSDLTDSAPGEDNISYSMLQHLPDNGLELLRNIINHMWSTGSFPNSWKVSTIIPILKKNKPPEDPASYRPIALLSCVAKTFEKLVKTRLEIIAESNKMIPPQFTGFRKDDLTLLIFSSSVLECIRKAEATNYAIGKWLKESGLAINPSKCEFLLFSNSRQKKNINSIKFKNDQIKRVQQHRLLGIIFDDNLSWKPHFDNLINTCRKGINIIKATCHRWWGANPNTAIILYKSLIRSRLEYGSSIFGNASTPQWKRLERVQNSAIRTILGSFPSSPIPALQLEAGIPPLSVRAKFLTNKFLLKVCSQKLHPLNDKLPRLQRYIQKVSKVDRENPLLLKQTVMHSCEQLTTGKTILFTDGSKNNNNSGCSVVNLTSGLRIGHKLPDSASIFTAEATAINLALRHIITDSNSDFAILSDAKSVLQALNNTSPQAKYNWILTQIRSKISILHVFNKSVIFIWIPAHCGIQGNETADQMAKSSAINGPVLQIPIPHTDIVPIIFQLQTKDWENHWESSWNEIDQNRTNPAEPSWYHTLVPRFPPNPYKPWFSKSKINRSIIFHITRLRIGHWAFPHLLHRLRMIQSNRCDCGSVVRRY